MGKEGNHFNDEVLKTQDESISDVENIEKKDNLDTKNVENSDILDKKEKNEQLEGQKIEETDSNNNESNDSQKPKKLSKKGLIICITVGSIILVGGAVGLTLGLTLGRGGNKSVTHEESVDEFLFSDATENVTDFDNEARNNLIVNDGNPIVVKTYEDFETNVKFKEDSKENFDFKNIEVYTYSDTANDSEKKISTDDYVINYDEKWQEANIKVLAKGVTDKIKIKVNLEPISFGALVEFHEKNDAGEDIDGYDYAPREDGEGERYYNMGVYVKKYRRIPDNTTFTYKYESQTKTNEPFSFSKEGTYPINLTITNSYYGESATYSVDHEFKIVRRELTDEQKKEFSFDKSSLDVIIGSGQGVTYNYSQEKECELSATPKVEYYYTEEQCYKTDIPQVKGNYDIKLNFKFHYKQDYEITGKCYVIPRGIAKVIFSISEQGGYWDEAQTQNENKSLDDVEFPYIGLTLKELLTKVEVSDPYKKGYDFLGWSKKGSTEIIDLYSSVVFEGQGEIILVPNFKIRDYKIEIDSTPSVSSGIIKLYNEYQQEITSNPVVEYDKKVYLAADKFTKTVSEKEIEFLPYGIFSTDLNESKIIEFKNTISGSSTSYIEFNMPALDSGKSLYITVIYKSLGGLFVNYDEEYLTASYSSDDNNIKFTYNYVSEAKAKEKRVYGVYIYSFNSKDESKNKSDWLTNVEAGKEQTFAKSSDYDSWIISFILVPRNYDINFFDNDGGTLTNPPETISGYFGYSLTDITEGVTTVDEKRAFKGWSKTINTDTLITSEDTMPSEALSLYAVWYKYNFVFADTNELQVSDKETKNLAYLDGTTTSGITVETKTDYTGKYQFSGYYDVYVGEEGTARCRISKTEDLKPGKFAVDPVLTDNVTITLKPVSEPVKHTISFDANGGTINNEPTNFQIGYGEKVLEALNKNGIYAYYSKAGFNYWTMCSDGSNYVKVDDTTTMPGGDITLKPVWDSYHIIFRGSTGINVGAEYKDGITVSVDDMDLTVGSGYAIDHYEISYDDEKTYKEIEGDLPVSPYEYLSSRGYYLQNLDNVYIKVVSVARINVFLDAGDGVFENGTHQRAYQVNSGLTWGDFVNYLEKPTLEGKTFVKWVDQYNNDISSDTVIDSAFTAFATYK